MPADSLLTYGTLYTSAVTVMGVRMLVKYRHSRYHLVHTVSVIFFQSSFAWLLPAIMERLHQPGMDLKSAWPLNYPFFMDWNLRSLLQSGNFWLFLLLWGIVFSLVAVPTLTYFHGKRWYCSRVCGCGGLAGTLGDPFRQLSSNSIRAWQVERYLIHSVLLFAVVMTIMQVANLLSGGSWFGGYTWRVNQWYSFLIGTGFYPVIGNRVWCRFGCPLAATMGIVQKYRSRFVITTNSGQCISCGNCSTYCGMRIDVRWYAQREQNIVRGSPLRMALSSRLSTSESATWSGAPRQLRHMNRCSRTDACFVHGASSSPSTATMSETSLQDRRWRAIPPSLWWMGGRPTCSPVLTPRGCSRRIRPAW
jgi:ferredoxin-type protein NapH